MMAFASIHVGGAKELERQLQGLGRGVARKVSRQLVRSLMRPVKNMARAEAPTETGRLRASIGLVSTAARRSSSVTARVGTREGVTYVNALNRTWTVTGSGKKRDRAIARGYQGDDRSVNLYAGGIEFGTKKSGRVARRRGGALMMNRAMERRKPRIIAEFERQLLRLIAKIKTNQKPSRKGSK